MKLCIVLISVWWLMIGNAGAADHSDEMFRRIGIALMDGQCSAVLQKQYQITASGVSTSSYISASKNLHQCQYVQEMAVSSACVVAKACPTYEDWSKANPEFYPSMSRHAFVSELDKRQSMVSVRRAASLR